MYVTVVFKTALNMHISSVHMTSVQVTAVNMMVVYVTVCVTAATYNISAVVVTTFCMNAM